MSTDGDTRKQSSVLQRLSRVKSIVGLDELSWWPQNTSPSGGAEPENLRRGIYSIFAESRSKIGKIMQVFLIVTILVSVVIILVATLPQYRFPTVGTREGDTLPVLNTIEAVCVIIFTIEYLAKLFTVPWQTLEELGALPDYGRTKWMPWPLRHVWLWFWSISNLIDFVAIIPFYIEMWSSGDVGSLAVLRVLRIGRVTRVIKLGKYSSGVQMLSAVMQNSLQYLYQLTFLISIFVILCGSLIFFAEQGEFVVPDECRPCFGMDACCSGNSTCVTTCGDFDSCCFTDDSCPTALLDRVCLQTNGYFERPDLVGTGREESPFVSIFTGFYWVFVTVTSVGYGEITPTTLTGRVISSFVMLSGLVVIALPIVVIVAGFTEWQSDQQRLKREKSAKAVIKTTKDRLQDLVHRFQDLSEEVERVNISRKRLEEYEANERASLRSLNHRYSTASKPSLIATNSKLTQVTSERDLSMDILSPPPPKPSDDINSTPVAKRPGVHMHTPSHSDRRSLEDSQSHTSGPNYNATAQDSDAGDRSKQRSV